MPGFLLNALSTVNCSHAGQGKPKLPSTKVFVDGQPVILNTDPYTIIGCPFSTAAGPQPCLALTWVSSSLNIVSDAIPILLVDSKANSIPNSTPALVIPSQVKVTGK